MDFHVASTQFDTLPPSCHADDLRDRMEAARQKIETKFLAAGAVLSDAVDGVGALIAGLEKLTEALEPSAMAATTDDLKTAAAKLSALPARQAERREFLQHLALHNQSFGEHIFDMRRSLGYMRAFTMNIKITAGGIAGADTEFRDFVQDISKCVELGRDELNGLDADVRALQQGLEGALKQGSLVEERCGALIPAIPDELSASVLVVAGHKQKVAQAASDAAALARDIRKKVARTLAALQIGDITRQRIEHVQAGVAMLEQSAATLSGGEGARMRGLMHALLAAQLASTVEDFKNDVADIVRSMSGLTADARALLDLKDLAYGRSDGKDDGFLRNLEHRVQAALGLVDEIDTANRKTLETGQSTAMAAQALSTRVATIQKIKLDVQYMAFNTVLKSTRLGEVGRPLSVIAAELRAHSANLEAQAGQCVAILDKLTQAAAPKGDRPDADDETETQAAARALAAATHRIHDAGNKTQGELSVLAIQGEDVLKLLDGSLSRFDLQREIGDPLDDVAIALAAFADDGDAATDVVEPMSALLSKLAVIYTMMKERDVHQAFLKTWGLDAASAPAVDSAAAQSDALEDVLF
jgi:hypothetical protein